MREANLESANLTEADVVNAILVGANLCKANLTSAEFQYSDLTDADLSGTNLTKAIVSDAVLNGARFINADLSSADFSGANFQGADLSGAVLDGTTLRNAKIYGVNLRNAKLVGADLDGLDLDQLVISEEDRHLFREERKKKNKEKMAGSADPDFGSVTGDGGPPPTQVHFTAFHPIELAPQVWNTLLVYAHVPGAAEAVTTDCGLRLANRASDYRKKLGVATKSIARGADLTFVPQLPGCRFNPSQAKVKWLEDWHCVEFRVQATPEIRGFEEGMAANGISSFTSGRSSSRK